ncbi:MAG: glycosyltransferase [Nanoarchaeota archaeon]|nr:glycosyltransferase [DPANN group archaeon]MBL7116708.1 glycosyltransferase [Nanoarchaeota archaeon]
MLISVVVLTFNRAQLLKTCLESLSGQDISKKKYEIVVVDDGSTDNTYSIANKYDVWYIKQKHSGVSTARNNGIRNAKGDIICFVADDYLFPENYLATINDFFKKHKSVDVISFSILTKDKSFYSQINDLHYKTRLRGTLSVFNSRRKFPDAILPASGAAAFRKEVFNKVGLFDENLPCLEDIDLAIRMKFSNLKHQYNPLKILRQNNKPLIPSLKEQFYKGKNYFFLKKKWGSSFKPALKTSFLGVLLVFFVTPILSLLRVIKLYFFKAVFFFFFMLILDYAFFLGYLSAYIEFFKK